MMFHKFFMIRPHKNIIQWVPEVRKCICKCLFICSSEKDSHFQRSFVLDVFLFHVAVSLMDFFFLRGDVSVWGKKDRKEEDQGVWIASYEEKQIHFYWMEWILILCADRYFIAQTDFLLVLLQWILSLCFMLYFKVQQRKHLLSGTTVKAETNGPFSLT